MSRRHGNCFGARCVLCLMAILFMLYFYSHHNNPNVNNYIIVSMPFSGAEFVENYFTNHDDMFYIREPFAVISQDSEGKRYLAQYGYKFINDIIHCDFEGLLNAAWNMYLYSNTPGLRIWTEYSFCTTFKVKECTRKNDPVLSSRCRNQSHVAATVLRLKDLSVLAPLANNGTRIAHIVRDPRGMLHDFILNDYKGNVVNEIDFYATALCQHMKLMLDTAARSLNPQSYLLLRYEDIVLDPVTQGQRLFDFLNLEMPDDVREWAEAKEEDTRLTAGDRNPETALLDFAWRSNLSWPDVWFIQEDCKNVMKKLGYTTFRDEEELVDEDISSLANPGTEF